MKIQEKNVIRMILNSIDTMLEKADTSFLDGLIPCYWYLLNSDNKELRLLGKELANVKEQQRNMTNAFAGIQDKLKQLIEGDKNG